MSLGTEYEQLARTIHDLVYAQPIRYKTTVFLCGAGADERTSLREKIANSLLTKGHWFRYEVYYPESLFDELLFGEQHHDLISLEEILAESVDAVVLIPESPGSLAELGAFSSNDSLRKKLVVLVDRKYRRDKSFINYGPLRLLRDTRSGEVIFFDSSDFKSLEQRLRQAISHVKHQDSRDVSVRSAVQAHPYVLSCIYLLQPVKRVNLVSLVKYASGQSTRRAEALTAGALAILNQRREIELTPDGYVLSRVGIQAFRRFGLRGTTRYNFDLSVLDDIRVGVLNWKLRGKPLTVGEFG